MLATNRSSVAFVSSHTCTETRLWQSCACGSGVESSPSLLKAPSSIPSTTEQTRKEPSLWCRGALGACTGSLGRGRRIRQEDQARQRCSHLLGGLDSGPALPLHAFAHWSLPVSFCVRWGHKLFIQPLAPL